MKWLLLGWLWLAIVGTHSLAHAHALSPALIRVQETAAGRFRLSFRRPLLAPASLALALPAGCAHDAATLQHDGEAFEQVFTLTCPRGLAGQELRVEGLDTFASCALVSASFADGRQLSAVLTPARPQFFFPVAMGALDVFAAYLRLGADHLLQGWDHLLFIAGLIAVTSGLSSLLWCLSAFTLGHSITLCLAALSLVSVAQAPVELGIALSLVGLALSLLARAPAEAAASKPPVRLRLLGVITAVGLLHGLGFAGALRETGLPSNQIPLSLLGFNCGIELAQVALVLPVLWLARRFVRADAARWLRPAAGYAIGGVSALWCIERTLLLWE